VRPQLAHSVARLGRDKSGLALLEFAFMLPLILVMSLTGAEMTNYITTKMRISQLALHIADDAARMGSGTRLAAKTITEADINDIFIGAHLQSGELDLRGRGYPDEHCRHIQDRLAALLWRQDGPRADLSTAGAKDQSDRDWPRHRHRTGNRAR